MPIINPWLQQLNPISSRSVSQRAKANPQILNLSMGEPDFGPPPHLLTEFSKEDLGTERFIDAMKRYEHSLGALSLRQAIAGWYRQRYGLLIDAEKEVLVTHGGIEAFNVALLALTQPGDSVTIADPSYTLYQRAIQMANRHCHILPRAPGVDEYAEALARAPVSASALLINSPENPTGYVMSEADWLAVTRASVERGSWVIHDEVYDMLAYTRRHVNAWCFPALRENSVLINSCSKKFGVPGLRIGWMIGPAAVIEAASRVHESLCLGVNILSENIAIRLLNDHQTLAWIKQQNDMLATRNQYALSRLGEAQGFWWPRQPMGGMFLFPNVSRLAQSLPSRWRDGVPDAGRAVANYLMDELEIAAVPGIAYGPASQPHLRLTNCASETVFRQAIDRLAALQCKESSL
ncbi:pyridoxal phosphate-dependent aminotransferase [Pantoea stewartii]|uniref:pyridoxal phosphate-dependent aminotransferase n=1 Tax=Pantoea stewartii TaxID=66269 RepID=UPI00249EBC3F|nr:pyridoxal phosphate-dependent aminotransferase [Pantoea stewartii]